jgi:hypothetical protein
MLSTEFADMDNPDRTLSLGYLRKTLLATLLAPFGILLLVSQLPLEPPVGEFAANLYSASLALGCWWLAWRILFSKVFGRRLFLTLTLLVILRLVLNLGHFYLVFAPLVGIESSADLPRADFAGDLGAIFNSALMFLDKYRDAGAFHAVFGDYYRSINNPGVAILYGWLFSIFGTFATTAVPWAIVYSGFAALVVGLIGLSLAVPARYCRAAVLLAFVMPGILVFPPIYRDNFTVYLLMLTGYSAFGFRRERVLLTVAVVVVESILLYSLRTAYLFVPLTFYGIVLILQSRREVGFAMRGVAFALLLIPVLLVSSSYLGEQASESLSRLSVPPQGDTGYPILTPFSNLGPLVFFPAAAVFLLLTPMPWWQDVPAPQLSYQVFSYAQTLYMLTTIAALVLVFREKKVLTETTILLSFFVMLFLLALLGTRALAAGYAQIGLPFLVLASIRYLRDRAGQCFSVATAVVVLAHLVLWIKSL